MPTRVLLVEDDAALARFLRGALMDAGIDLLHAPSCERGLDLLCSEPVDVVLLDATFPSGMGGLEFLSKLRRDGRSTPVVLVTGSPDGPDVVRGLQLGADDYLKKPFLVPELVARIHAILRRVAPAQHRSGAVTFDEVTRVLRYAEGSVHLTDREADLLTQLLHVPGHIVPYDALCIALWGHDSPNLLAALRRLVYELRRRLESLDLYDAVQTVRGEGVRFVPPGDRGGEMEPEPPALETEST